MLAHEADTRKTRAAGPQTPCPGTEPYRENISQEPRWEIGGTPVAFLLVENHWSHVREDWETVWQFAQCMQYVWVTKPSLGVWGLTIWHKPIGPQRGCGKLHSHGVGRPELQAWVPGCMTQAGPSLFKDLTSGVNGKFPKLL